MKNHSVRKAMLGVSLLLVVPGWARTVYQWEVPTSGNATQLIQDALNGPDQITIIADGVFHVTGINVPEGKTLKSTTGNAVLSSLDTASKLVCLGSGSTLDGLILEGNQSNVAAAVYANESSRLRIKNCKIRNFIGYGVQIINAKAATENSYPGPIIDWVKWNHSSWIDSWTNWGVILEGNQILGSQSIGTRRGIYLESCNWSVVKNSTIKTSQGHSIMAWGAEWMKPPINSTCGGWVPNAVCQRIFSACGDKPEGVIGYLIEKRSSHLYFLGNMIETSRGGDGGCGIFVNGSKYVLYQGNTVSDTRDMALDVEWCENVSIRNNKVFNFLNAGIGVLFYSKNISIEFNSIINNDPTHAFGPVSKAYGAPRASIWLQPKKWCEAFSDEDVGNRNVFMADNSITALGLSRHGILPDQGHVRSGGEHEYQIIYNRNHEILE